MDMSEKTVLVSGSTRGIGLAIAQKFSGLNANVVITGTTDRVFTVAEELKNTGGCVVAVKADVTRYEDAERMVNTAVDRFGKLDILINNAGVTRDQLLIRMSEADWDTVMDTNLKGTFLLTKAASKFMMKKRYGRIINITSVVGVMGNAGQANYAASKAGMIGFTKSIAKELSSRNVTCNAIAPGFIETQMTGDLPDNIKENYLKSIPAGRFGLPAEVADLAVFLSSDNAAYITGQVIHIDGGLYM